MNRTTAQGILEKVLKCAKADAVVASLHGEDAASTRMSDNVITQNVQCRKTTLHVECAYGQRHGSASTDDLHEEALKAAVERAQTIAQASPPDEEYLPPVEAVEAGKYARVDAFCERTARSTPEEKARALAAAAQQVQAAKLRLSGGFASGARFFALANSAGLRAYHAMTEASFHATVLGPAGSGWAECTANRIGGIDVAATARKALETCRAAQNPRPVEPGPYDVILSPAAIGEMMRFAFQWTLDAKSADEGRSCLRGKLGTQVFGRNIGILSDPAEPTCPTAPFFGDGMAVPRIAWVEQGVLKNLAYSRFWAKKQGRTPTGHPTNLRMKGGDTSLERMIASVGRGLLVNRFWYIRYVDPMRPTLTGMTRDGLFLIEDGRIAGPVQQMRFNEDTTAMLNRVEMLGPVERTGSALMPTVKVKDFHFDSATKF